MIFRFILISIVVYILFFKNSDYTPKTRRNPIHVATEVLTKHSWDPQLGTLAGKRYYRDFWTRDCFFSSLGLLAIAKYEHVYHNLCTMRQYTRNDGLVPLRVGTYSHIPRFLFGIDLPGITPIYHDDKHGEEPTDSNPQYIILVNEYVKHNGTGNMKLLIEHCKKVYQYSKKKANKNQYGLLYGRSFDTWHDSFDINGECLFSNVLWAQCQQSMMELFRDDRQLYTECKMRYKSLQNTIMKHYW
jgi:glycogen debranching enzyme